MQRLAIIELESTSIESLKASEEKFRLLEHVCNCTYARKRYKNTALQKQNANHELRVLTRRRIFFMLPRRHQIIPHVGLAHGYEDQVEHGRPCAGPSANGNGSGHRRLSP